MAQFVAVAFVLLLLWGAVLYLRKKGIAAWKTPLRKTASVIQQVDRMRLGPQHSIHLLRISEEGRAERTILVAVHPQGATLLEEGARSR